MSTFSERLYALRMANGESQESVADAIGVTRVAFTRYENGTREPKAITALRIAQHFNVSVEQLFDVGDPETDTDKLSMTDEERQIVTAYRSMNRQGKEYIRQQIAIATTIYKNNLVPDVEGKAIS